MREASVKGNQIALNKEYLVKRFGQKQIDELISRMDAAGKMIYSQTITSGGWYPRKPTHQLLDLAEEVLGKGDYEISYQAGRYVADGSVPRFYKIFLQIGNPWAVVNAAPRFWKQVHGEDGQLEIEKTGPKSVASRITNYTHPTKSFCAAYRGYAERVLEMSGAKNISMTESQCVCNGAPSCEFPTSWE